MFLWRNKKKYPRIITKYSPLKTPLVFLLRGLDTLSRFSAIFDKGDNFCGVLCCFLPQQAHYEKRSIPKGKNLLPTKDSKFFPFRVGSFSKGKQNNFDRFSLSESVSVYLKICVLTKFVHKFACRGHCACMDWFWNNNEKVFNLAVHHFSLLQIMLSKLPANFHLKSISDRYPTDRNPFWPIWFDIDLSRLLNGIFHLYIVGYFLNLFFLYMSKWSLPSLTLGKSIISRGVQFEAIQLLTR